MTKRCAETCECKAGKLEHTKSMPVYLTAAKRLSPLGVMFPFSLALLAATNTGISLGTSLQVNNKTQFATSSK